MQFTVTIRSTHPTPSVTTSCAVHVCTPAWFFKNALALWAFVNVWKALIGPIVELGVNLVFTRFASMAFLLALRAVWYFTIFALNSFGLFIHTLAIQNSLTVSGRTEKQLFIPQHKFILLKLLVFSVAIVRYYTFYFFKSWLDCAAILWTSKIMRLILIFDLSPVSLLKTVGTEGVVAA